MDRDVRITVAIDRLHAEIKQLPALSGIPEPDRLAGWQHLHFLERFLQTHGMKHMGAVSTDLYAGAKLAQFRRLLVNVDIDAAADQGERGHQTTDAAADDRDIVHAHSPLPTLSCPRVTASPQRQFRRALY